MLDVGSIMNRRWLITVSLGAHIGLGVFLFATGVWRIEKLDSGRADLALAIMMPPAAPEGGPPAGEKPKDPVKKQKKKPDDIVQPEKKLDTSPLASVASETPGTGEGSGSGSGSGSGESTGTCVGDCPGDDAVTAAVCGNGVLETGETCDDGNLTNGDGCSKTCTREEQKKVVLVPPTVLQGLRISGETQIQAPDTAKTEMMRDGKDRTLGTLKICIATDGGISSASVAASTKYAAYDAKLLSTVRSWRYRPYLVNGTPMPVCSTVTFVYTIK
jgi:TonB family protein